MGNADDPGSESDDRLKALERITELHQSGALTDSEFNDEKRRILQPMRRVNRAGSRLKWIAVGAAIAIAAAMFVVFQLGGGESHGLEGVIKVQPQASAFNTQIQETRPGTFGVGASCTGRSVSSGYSDIGPGMDVVVRDRGGTVIGTGDVATGEWTSEPACEMPFSVSDLPGTDFYSIEIGRRGEQNFDREELEQLDWTVELTIGG